MKEKLIETMKYYIARYILEFDENNHEIMFFQTAYSDSDLDSDNSEFKFYFQTHKCDNILNNVQRDILKKISEIIDYENKLNKSESIYSNRIIFYKQIIDEYENKSDFDYEKYFSMVKASCFNLDIINIDVLDEFLEYFGVQDENDFTPTTIDYYYRVSLQSFFIELYKYLNINDNITRDFVYEQNGLLSREYKDLLKKERCEIESIRCCCIINNTEKIFNYIDGSISHSLKLTSKLKYYTDKNDKSSISNTKYMILKKLMDCISDYRHSMLGSTNYADWTLKWNGHYMFFDGEKLSYCDYPAFFVSVDERNTNILDYLEGEDENVNVLSYVGILVHTIIPFMKSIGIDMREITIEPCFEHAELFSRNILLKPRILHNYSSFKANEDIENKIKFDFYEF